MVVNTLGFQPSLQIYHLLKRMLEQATNLPEEIIREIARQIDWKWTVPRIPRLDFLSRFRVNFYMRETQPIFRLAPFVLPHMWPEAYESDSWNSDFDNSDDSEY